MWSLFERAKKVIFALVLSIVPLVLLYVQSKDHEVRSILAWPVTEISGLIERGTLNITGGISDILYRYFFLSSRTDELLSLRAEVLKTRALEARVKGLQNEKNTLLQLSFNRQEQPHLPAILARIIAKAGAPMSRMMRLDRGANHGVSPKNPVIANDGAVGQVLSVAPNFCDVLLITDASSAIEAKLLDTDTRGLLRGITSSKEYLMEIRDLDGLSEVLVGDVVVTSGINSSFPGGIPIGKIIDVFKSKDALHVSAKIEPFARMEKLDHVLILTNDDESISRAEMLEATWPMAAK